MAPKDEPIKSPSKKDDDKKKDDKKGKDGKKGKAADKEEDELSEEDQALQAQMALLVERVVRRRDPCQYNYPRHQSSVALARTCTAVAQPPLHSLASRTPPNLMLLHVPRRASPPSSVHRLTHAHSLARPL